MNYLFLAIQLERLDLLPQHLLREHLRPKYRHDPNGIKLEACGKEVPKDPRCLEEETLWRDTFGERPGPYLIAPEIVPKLILQTRLVLQKVTQEPDLKGCQTMFMYQLLPKMKSIRS